jgi:type I restriction enzyme S subunit
MKKKTLGAPAEWPQARVEDVKAASDSAVAIGPFGSRMKASLYVESGVPVIRGTNISHGRALSGDWVYVSDETADELRGCNLFADDLVFPHRGAIGQVGIVPCDGRARYMLSTSLMKLTCDRRVAEPLFLFYYFRSRFGRHALLKHASTVGTPGIGQPLTSLKSILVPVPSLEEQRAIAHVLGTLDDKIELNWRMNETLEAMARALFQSWFVDFDPVRAKAEGRDPSLPKPIADLFPSRLVDSELGEIPEGWRLGQVGDVVAQTREQIDPLETPEALFHHFSLPAFDNGQIPVEEPGGGIKSQKSIVPPGTILLSKLNPEIERVWLVDVPRQARAVCSTEFLVLAPKAPFGQAFAYCLARSPSFRRQIESLVTGTSKSHQRAHAEAILRLSAVLPPPVLVERFEAGSSPLLERTLGCRAESRTLAALRDTLLPKLISGELRVPQAEKIVGEVL